MNQHTHYLTDENDERSPRVAITDQPDSPTVLWVKDVDGDIAAFDLTDETRQWLINELVQLGPVAGRLTMGSGTHAGETITTETNAALAKAVSDNDPPRRYTNDDVLEVCGLAMTYVDLQARALHDGVPVRDLRIAEAELVLAVVHLQEILEGDD